MDLVRRKALRKYNGLRQQLDNALLGENGDEWEDELKKFLAKQPCWVLAYEVVERFDCSCQRESNVSGPCDGPEIPIPDVFDP